MLELIFLLPMLTGLTALFVPITFGRWLLLVAALFHFQLTVMAWFGKLPVYTEGFFSAAPIGLLVLLLTSFVFLCIAVYAICYVREVEMENEQVFHGCMLLFLGTMSMVSLADHPIVLWIAIEATTLISAPLIYVHKSREALEATWKYVIICSVGIALALLGCFFISLSIDIAEINIPLTFTSLNQVAGQLDPVWLKAGFIFIIIGFGTKMGLAPMHTWLPDAHSQAPSPASGLLSGALLNCAFLGIYKAHTLMYLAGLGDFSSKLLIGFGLTSMLVAGVFMVRQGDYKRMLAYSSIENMGIIAFGIGIGGVAVYGAIIHMIHHSLIKSSLFLSSGNILLGFKTKLVGRIGNMAKYLPKTFCAFFAGFVGISGLPPFGLFVSELFILIGTIRGGHPLCAVIFIFCLLLVVAGAAQIVTDMSFSENVAEVQGVEKFLRIFPPYVLLGASIFLTIWIPDRIYVTILDTIKIIGGTIYG